MLLNTFKVKLYKTKEKRQRFTLPDFKLYYKTTIIKTTEQIILQNNNNQKNNRIESLEINPHVIF